MNTAETMLGLILLAVLLPDMRGWIIFGLVAWGLFKFVAGLGPAFAEMFPPRRRPRWDNPVTQVLAIAIICVAVLAMNAAGWLQ